MNHSEPDRILETLPLLRSEPEYGALICLTCNNGYPWKRIVRHLNTHEIKIDLYGPILKSFECEDLAKDWENIRRPVDGSAAIEGLRIRRGHVCMGCGHKTTSDSTPKKHFECGGEYRPVSLQCWNRISDPVYWIVTPPQQEPADNASFISQAGSFTP
jgi:hypothetical protein